MASVIADPTLFLDQVRDTCRRPQTTLVSQSLRPSLQAAFDAPQILWSQACFASCSSGPLERPNSTVFELLRPATDRLSMSLNTTGHLRRMYALAQ